MGIILSGTGSDRAFIQRQGKILHKKDGKEAVLYEIASAETSEVQHCKEKKKTIEAIG